MTNNILKLIGPQKKKKLFALIVLMFFGSLLEMLSIAMIMEVCSFLTDMDAAGSRFIGRLFRLAGIGTGRTVLVCCLVCFIALYLFKIAYLLFKNRAIARFVCDVQHEISSRLFEDTLHRPYIWFTGAGTAELINLLSTDTVRTGTYLDAFMELAAESLVLAVLGAALVFISPAMTLCIFLGAGLSLLLTRSLIRPFAYRTGETRQAANAQRLKWLKQGIQGIKEVKTWQAEQRFSEYYGREDAIVADCDSCQRALTKIPGLCIEAIMAVSVLSYVLLLTLARRDVTDALPDLAALAAASIRLLPAIRRISGNLVRITNTKASEEAILAALDHIPTIKTPQSACPADEQEEADLSGGIAASGVTFSYKNRPEPILKNVDIEIPAGTSVGITGSSGIGKTTLIDLLLGLLEPQEGCVRIGGTDIRRCLESYLRQTAYIPQNIFLLNDTIRNNVIFREPAENADDRAVWTALRQASLEDFVKKLPDGPDTLIGENGIRLSGGERQRLGIARALYRGSKFLVFDEATSALDPDTEAAVLRSIQALHGKKTMLIISHRASAVAGCDWIYRMEDGSVRLTGAPL